MRDRTFSFILDELQSARLASEMDAARYALSIHRFRTLAQPIVESAADGLTCQDSRSDDLLRARSAYARDDAPEYKLGTQRSLPDRMTLAELRFELDRAPSVEMLGTLRRRFAMGRHPDRVERTERRQATAEMQMANDLIDQAIGECNVLRACG